MIPISLQGGINIYETDFDHREATIYCGESKKIVHCNTYYVVKP